MGLGFEKKVVAGEQDICFDGGGRGICTYFAGLLSFSHCFRFSR